jgi:uncharacterized membrane protein YgdD (TMEM256/DUF423 family)
MLPTSAKIFLAIGSIAAGLAVALGAFGAHALKNRLPDDLLATWNTAVQYHFYHALGLLLVGLVLSTIPGAPLARWAGWAMVAGLVLFSGSLYALCLSGVRGLGAITPFGGMAFILAWLLLAGAVIQVRV